MSAVSPLTSSESSADKRAYEPSMEEILASIRRIIADDQSLPGRSAARDPEPAPPLRRDLPRPVPSAPPSSAAVANDTPVAASFPVPPVPAPPIDAGLAHGSIATPQFATPEGPAIQDRMPEDRVAERRVIQDHAMQDHAMQDRAEQERVADAFARETRAEALPPETIAAPEPDVQERVLPAYADPHASTESEAGAATYDPPIAATPSRQAPSDNPALFSAATDSAVSAAFNMLAASRLADNSDELMTLAREMIRPLLRSWIDDNLPGMVERMVRAEIERVARGGR